VRSRESLESALADFDGTLVVVSHDRRFLDKLVDRLVIFPSAAESATAAPETAGRVTVFLGNYADWVRRRAARAAAAASDAAGSTGSGNGSGRSARSAASAAGTTGERAAGRAATGADGAVLRPLSKNEQSRRRDWIAAVEGEIAGLEEEQEATVAAMGDPDLDADRRHELGRRSVEIEAELTVRLERWEQWNRELEEGVAD
jgi:hypothetical protein